MSDQSEIEKKLIGTRGFVMGDHPFAGESGVIVRIGDTPWGRRPVVRIDSMGGHECFVTEASQWAPHHHGTTDWQPPSNTSQGEPE